MTTITTLVGLAEKAAPEIDGNWWDEDGLEELSREGDGGILATGFEPAEIAFIAAASPSAILQVEAEFNQLQAENKRLKDALKPFAEFAPKVEQFVNGRVTFGGSPIFPTKAFSLADFDRAASAYCDGE